ncbi:hypothetical protein N7463_002488 [Penicillium fimorum]|uniref:Uncharacterized protein n=1 Tax=Penicillium fimorum TaxID=1882269 RepID=A0A9W9XZC4_9EURO|nr:hypothetical protein N7463_002488 [Penicillium fimorum]
MTWPVESTPSGVTTANFDTREFLKYSVRNQRSVGLGYGGRKDGVGPRHQNCGQEKDSRAPVVKRWKATTEAVLSVLNLWVSLADNILDAKEGTKNEILIVNAFLESTVSFGGTWGGSVVAWNYEL